MVCRKWDLGCPRVSKGVWGVAIGVWHVEKGSGVSKKGVWFVSVNKTEKNARTIVRTCVSGGNCVGGGCTHVVVCRKRDLGCPGVSKGVWGVAIEVWRVEKGSGVSKRGVWCVEKEVLGVEKGSWVSKKRSWDVENASWVSKSGFWVSKTCPGFELGS